MRWRRGRNIRVSWPTVAWLGVGALLATLTFSHAAASVGVAIEPFRPLGGNFFALRGQQSQLLSTIGPTGEVSQPRPLVTFGQTVLEHSPLSPRPAWLLALGYEANGDIAKARKAMQSAERISRREAGVQLWLATDLLRRNDAEGGMRHFDTLLLSASDEVSAEILTRLATAFVSPDARKALGRYAREDNPWYGGLIDAAARTLPDPEPVAQFLVELGRPAPDGELERAAYNTLMRRLAAERSYLLMTEVYPRLPGADPAELRSVTVRGTGQPAAYPPIGWDLSNSNERGGLSMSLGEGRPGLEFFAGPGTVGTAGQKLLAPGPARRLRFRIADQTANPDSSAHWVATCVGNGGGQATTRSPNLMTSSSEGPLAFDLPASCGLVLLEMSIAGGTGRESSSLVVERLELIRAD